MTRIEVTLKDTAVKTKLRGALTSGMVGVPVEFSFDSAWDGLSKIAVFQGCCAKTRALVETNATTVPHEVLKVPGLALLVGVEGRKSDGTLVYPSVMTKVGVIQIGADASAAPGTDPSPTIYDDIMAAIAKIHEEGVKLAPGEIDRIVKEHLAKHPPEPGYSPTVATEAIDGGYRITIQNKDGTQSFEIFHGKQGEQGVPGKDGVSGKDGADGYTPQKGVDYCTEEDKAELVGDVLRELSDEYMGATDDGTGIVTLGKLTLPKASLLNTPSFYYTDREAFENADTVVAEDIWALYRGLGAVENPLYDNEGNFVTYEYVFSTGDYNTIGECGIPDADIKKPVFLVQSGIHGLERTVVMSTYRFFADLASRKNLPACFPEGAIFKVVPVAVPWSFDTERSAGVLGRRINKNGVNINRNFDYNWTESDVGDNANYSGPSAASEAETQAITNWLRANKDAALYIDMHTSVRNNELVALVGPKWNSAVTRAKKVGLRGLDKVIPYWKTQIGYSDDTIFSYSSCLEGFQGNAAVGIAVYYAAEILGIPSLALECASIWDADEMIEIYTPEIIAVCAEVLGNVLIETYKQEVCNVITIT